MKKIIVVLSILAMLLMISCGDNNNATIDEQKDVASEIVTEVYFDHDISLDLEELTGKATHVVVGEMVKPVDVVNLARDFNDHSLASKDELYEAERSIFKVTKVLKGDLSEEEIVIVSATAYQDYALEDSERYELSYFNELKLGEQVIVFLNYNTELGEIFPIDFAQFEPASSPYLFSFDNKKTVKLIEKDNEVKSLFNESEFEFDYEKLEKIIEKEKDK